MNSVDKRLSAQVWARQRVASKDVFGTHAQYFEHQSDSVHAVGAAHYGCPLTASACARPGPCVPRAPHMLSPVVDGGTGKDEYLMINSICRSDPSEDVELDSSLPEGGETIVNLSAHRLPSTFADRRLCAAGKAPPADRRVLDEEPDEAEEALCPAHDNAAAARARAVPSPVHAGWRKHVRQRDLRLDACVRHRRAKAEAHCAALAAEAAAAPDAKQTQFAHLSDAQIAQLQALLDQHPDQISHSSDDMGSVPAKYADYFLKLPTEEGKGCVQRPYRLSFKEKGEFERQVANLLEKGVIAPATAPTNFVSPVLFVPKPRDPTALRMCVDFRRLNAVTKRDLHALPDVQGLLQQMKGCRFFTALDLSSGFWALPIAEADQHKTAFTGPDGKVYVWRKAAMGLSNSPAAFQRFMAHVLRDIPGVSVYIDDVTVYSATWEDHLSTLEQVFARAADAGLKFKFSKCVWAAAECRVLGSIVNEQGIAPDPEKTEAIQQLPVPRNTADVRSFLGATGYFHAHIKDFAHKSDPLRRLLKKETAFNWTADCQAAFETLKQDLVSDSVLRMPDVSQPFVLTTDWSKAAIGAVLSQFQPEDPANPASPQKEFVIAYASRALSPAESNYAPTEGECLALVWATRKFRQFLHGQAFTARTDHAALKWLTTARFENSKLERWAMRLQEFTFEVEYLPGPDNVVADHLSRHMTCAHLVAGSAAACAGHLAYAMANKVMDLVADGGDVLNPPDWVKPRLRQLWALGDAEAMAQEPCWQCGEAEGHASMVLCDTCGRPFHMQCCHPPRSVVPDGQWHCHLCDEAFENAHELERTEDQILFPRESDVFHPAIADDVALYAHTYARTMRVVHQVAAADGKTVQGHGRAKREADDALLEACFDARRRRRIRRLAERLRVHPTLPEWYMMRETLRGGETVWLGVPPPRYRWGLVGAYHDRTGHAGINQTLLAMRQNVTWPGIKEDVQAYVSQCHPCQVQRLEQEHVHEPIRPDMSAPFEHVHIDLAGPFACRDVRGAEPRRKGSVSTEKIGHKYVCIIVDYFTKAAEFVSIPDKSSASVARAFHDRWLMRYGAPEWVTSDNGLEFGGAFRHQLARFGVDHVTISPYHPQANGAVERLVRTLKKILAAKVAGAMHDWEALLPQVQAEYMHRRHTSSGYSPNELVYARKVHLPPPVGPLQRGVRLSSCTLASAETDYVQRRDDAYGEYVEAAYGNLCRAQLLHLRSQARRVGSRAQGGETLNAGDLAYLLAPHGRKQVDGPFVVVAVCSEPDARGQMVTLRTTAAVAEQTVKTFKVRRERVARCTTVTDALERLLRSQGLPAEQLDTPHPDALASWHTGSTGGVSPGT